MWEILDYICTQSKIITECFACQLHPIWESNHLISSHPGQFVFFPVGLNLQGVPIVLIPIKFDGNFARGIFINHVPPASAASHDLNFPSAPRRLADDGHECPLELFLDQIPVNLYGIQGRSTPCPSSIPNYQSVTRSQLAARGGYVWSGLIVRYRFDHVRRAKDCQPTQTTTNEKSGRPRDCSPGRPRRLVVRR